MAYYLSTQLYRPHVTSITHSQTWSSMEKASYGHFTWPCIHITSPCILILCHMIFYLLFILPCASLPFTTSSCFRPFVYKHWIFILYYSVLNTIFVQPSFLTLPQKSILSIWNQGHIGDGQHNTYIEVKPLSVTGIILDFVLSCPEFYSTSFPSQKDQVFPWLNNKNNSPSRRS